MTSKFSDPNSLFAAIADGPISSEELLHMSLSGCTHEEARAHFKERARVRKAADAIEGQPLETWPAFDVRWDLDQRSFYRVYDGANPDQVNADELVLIPDVSLAAIDAALTPHWHRTAEEVWTVGSPDKAARAIVHWHEGGRMTPPLIIPTSDGRLTIGGGNHRLAVARAKGTALLPVLVKEDQETRVRDILQFQ
ncbi:hypothetical protein V1286_000439 [Bradyrhizobium algeriense]|uniref:ParB/Sulfiredoxin domain-containing protein n=1 Tax=Bradyrhizobium algeriense TaxID=634784 RepID=A0ABU8B2Z7_9BRAD